MRWDPINNLGYSVNSDRLAQYKVKLVFHASAILLTTLRRERGDRLLLNYTVHHLLFKYLSRLLAI